MPTTIHVSQAVSPNQEIEITGEDAFHLLRVLRLREGEGLKVADAALRLFQAFVLKSGKHSVRLLVKSELPPPPAPYPIRLYLSLLKKEKMEWIIEKAVELNIEAVHLFPAERSIREELNDHKWQRLQKIADEALKQCGRLIPLRLEKYAGFDPARAAQNAHEDALNLFCDELAPPGSQQLLIPEAAASRPVNLWIGPEGGWTEAERELASKNGFETISLAPLILRAETAALHAMSLATFLQARLKNLF